MGWTCDGRAEAPAAKIVLVEAKTNSFTNLFKAMDVANRLPATEVSMSWGGGGFSSETSSDHHMTHAGTFYTASSGDSGARHHLPVSFAERDRGWRDQAERLQRHIVRGLHQRVGVVGLGRRRLVGRGDPRVQVGLHRPGVWRQHDLRPHRRQEGPSRHLVRPVPQPARPCCRETRPSTRAVSRPTSGTSPVGAAA